MEETNLFIEPLVGLPRHSINMYVIGRYRLVRCNKPWMDLPQPGEIDDHRD